MIKKSILPILLLIFIISGEAIAMEFNAENSLDTEQKLPGVELALTLINLPEPIAIEECCMLPISLQPHKENMYFLSYWIELFADNKKVFEIISGLTKNYIIFEKDKTLASQGICLFLKKTKSEVLERCLDKLLDIDDSHNALRSIKDLMHYLLLQSGSFPALLRIWLKEHKGHEKSRDVQETLSHIRPSAWRKLTYDELLKSYQQLVQVKNEDSSLVPICYGLAKELNTSTLIRKRELRAKLYEEGNIAYLLEHWLDVSEGDPEDKRCCQQALVHIPRSLNIQHLQIESLEYCMKELLNIKRKTPLVELTKNIIYKIFEKRRAIPSLLRCWLKEHDENPGVREALTCVEDNIKLESLHRCYAKLSEQPLVYSLRAIRHVVQKGINSWSIRPRVTLLM